VYGCKIVSEKFEPNIVAFLCNWCSYAGADLAGTSRIQYSANVKIIRVMCSGRVNPVFIINAFQNGLDGVIIGGCHPGECHYESGNYLARRRVTVLKKLLEYIGIDPRRIQLAWVSASEGNKFADVINKYTEEIKKLGPVKKIVRRDGW
jgi:coenzyme F420-reducing hydrogenase delta subunit